MPMRAISVPLKFQREGISYDQLSEAERDQWDSLEWSEDGEVPDGVDADAVNKWLFNTDTVDQVLKTLMTHGQKVAGGDRLGKTIIFAKNSEHAKFIAERFNVVYPEYAGSFAQMITYQIEYIGARSVTVTESTTFWFAARARARPTLTTSLGIDRLAAWLRATVPSSRRISLSGVLPRRLVVRYRCRSPSSRSSSWTFGWNVRSVHGRTPRPPIRFRNSVVARGLRTNTSAWPKTCDVHLATCWAYGLNAIRSSVPPTKTSPLRPGLHTTSMTWSTSETWTMTGDVLRDSSLPSRTSSASIT